MENSTVYNDCIERAKEVVRILVDDFDVKFVRDYKVKSITLHIAQMYYLFETNQSFAQDRKEQEFRVRQMLEALKEDK
jgi:hypothetical protein